MIDLHPAVKTFNAHDIPPKICVAAVEFRLFDEVALAQVEESHLRGRVLSLEGRDS